MDCLKDATTIVEVDSRIAEIQKELDRHDKAYAEIEADLPLVNGEYTQEMFKKHMGTIINNVIYLKECLEKLQSLKAEFEK